MLKYCSVLVILFIIAACNHSDSVGVIDPYEPDEPIEFNHTIHAGDNGIDCNYCHNTRTETDRTELTTNICLNCHQTVSGVASDTVNYVHNQ